MLLFIIGLTVLYGLLCLIALVSIAGALVASVRRAVQGLSLLVLVFSQRQRGPAKSNGIAEKCAERRKAW